MGERQATGDSVSVGDELVAIQTWSSWDRDRLDFFDKTCRFPVTVHYVRRRGDYQVDTQEEARWWVDERGYMQGDHIAGIVRLVHRDRHRRPPPADAETARDAWLARQEVDGE